MKIRNGRVYLTDDEHAKTRNLVATQLNCGHNVIPKLKGTKHLEKVECLVCRRKTMVIGDSVYEEPK